MHIEIGTAEKSQTILHLFAAFLIFSAAGLLFSCESKKQPQGEAQGVAATAPDNAPATAQQEGSGPASLPAADTSQDLAEKPINTPKGVSKAKLVLESKNNIDTVKVVVTGGEGAGFKYAWTKNGEPAGEGDSISGFKRGDKIAVTITPFEGKVAGEPKTLGLEIGNSVPKIVESKQLGFDGKTLTYQIKAVDPDGDTLSYSIADGPKGMTIDKSSGIITWQLQKDVSGKYPVKIKISDGHGGEVLYELNVDISTAKPQEK